MRTRRQSHSENRQRPSAAASRTRREFLYLISGGCTAGALMTLFNHQNALSIHLQPDPSTMQHDQEIATTSQTDDDHRDALDHRDEMHYTRSADGTEIGYVKRGTGPPVLFVHGSMADRRSWLNFAPHIEQAVTVYAMDRRGRGESGDAPDYTFDREAEDVAAVVEAIGGPVTLFGHSFGGLCSLEAALITDEINRLIIYEAPVPTGDPIIPDGVPEAIQALLDDGKLEEAMELCLREVAQIPDHELEAYRATPLWKARIPLATTIPRELEIERTYRFDPARFADLDVPTMLLLGGESPTAYPDATERLHAALPNSRIVDLPGQQHLAHHTGPDLLASEILRFVVG